MLGDEVLATWRVEDHDARDAGRPGRPRQVGDVPVASPGSGSRRTSGSRPASSSRTSSPGSAAVPRWSRRASPDSRRPSSCTTPGGSATRGRPGASSRATRSTMPSGRSRPRPASTSPWTCCSNDEQRITRAFGAASSRCTPRPARRPGRRRCNRSASRSTSSITTNSGYPLDQNLYQAVKGMSAAAEDRASGRHDHLRRRVPRRAAGPRRRTAGSSTRARSPADLLDRIAASPTTSRTSGRSRSRHGSR